MNDLYTRVTERIVAALEAGTPPWIVPWRACGPVLPSNFSTGKTYRGINTLLLMAEAADQGYEHRQWLTLRQANQLGGTVRKGERGTTVVFFKWCDAEPEFEDEHSERRVVPLLRAFTVFNLAQIDGLNLPAAETPLWQPEELAEDLLLGSRARLTHGGNRAFYSPLDDAIHLPPQAWFPDASAYYATALHELTHWTGHPARCNRPLGRRHGLDAYAFEELIAEMGAAFLCAHCRLPARLEHASYIDSWLSALRGDKRLIFVAAGKAQSATDFVLRASGVVPGPVSEALAA